MNFAWLILALHIVAATLSITHALLYKKDPRSALGWIATCFAYPLIGPLLYCFFGVNRVKTRAYRLKGKPTPFLFGTERPEINNSGVAFLAPVDLPAIIANDPIVNSLAQCSAALTHRPLLQGNHLTPLFNGETAYASMIEAIGNATKSICLSSYIFETNHSGCQFIEALVKAKQRGIEVRVLLDGFGEYYSFPKAGSLLKSKGIDVGRFIPPSIIPPSVNINLRNHRKLLIVDTQIGFTGGMNIGDSQLQTKPNGSTGINDIHFALKGSIVQQLQEVFNEDWAFVTGTTTKEVPYFQTVTVGEASCRVVTDGPNEDLEKLVTIITSGAALARKRICIMTPYFLPPAVLVNALQTAALRGVEVSIILPAVSNQPLVHWATRNMLWELLQFGVKVYYQPPPFNHSKLLLIDDHYAQIGSANLDSRSLRLNFELIVEIFDIDLVKTLSEHFSTTLNKSQEITLNEIDQRKFLVRIRDAVAWLFSAYL